MRNLMDEKQTSKKRKKVMDTFNKAEAQLETLGLTLSVLKNEHSRQQQVILDLGCRCQDLEEKTCALQSNTDMDDDDSGSDSQPKRKKLESDIDVCTPEVKRILQNQAKMLIEKKKRIRNLEAELKSLSKSDMRKNGEQSHSKNTDKNSKLRDELEVLRSENSSLRQLNAESSNEHQNESVNTEIMEKLEAKLEKQRKKVLKRDRMLEEKDREILERDQFIATHETQVEDLKENIKRLNAKLENQSAQHAADMKKLNDRVNEANAKLPPLKKGNQLLENEIKNLRATQSSAKELNRDKQRIEQLKEKIKEKITQIRALNEDNDNLHKSCDKSLSLATSNAKVLQEKEQELAKCKLFELNYKNLESNTLKLFSELFEEREKAGVTSENVLKAKLITRLDRILKADVKEHLKLLEDANYSPADRVALSEISKIFFQFKKAAYDARLMSDLEFHVILIVLRNILELVCNNDSFGDQSIADDLKCIFETVDKLCTEPEASSQKTTRSSIESTLHSLHNPLVHDVPLDSEESQQIHAQVPGEQFTPQRRKVRQANRTHKSACARTIQ